MGAGSDRSHARNSDELRALLRELMALNLVLAEFGERAAARLRVTRRDLVALTAVVEHEQVTAGYIGDLVGLTSGAATGVINRLEAAGYASRQANPRDARSVVVAPTPEGVRALEDLWQDATHALRQGLEVAPRARVGDLLDCVRVADAALKNGSPLLHRRVRD